MRFLRRADGRESVVAWGCLNEFEFLGFRGELPVRCIAELSSFVQALRHCVNSRDARLSIPSITTFWWHRHLPGHGHGKPGQHFGSPTTRLAAPCVGSRRRREKQWLEVEITLSTQIKSSKKMILMQSPGCIHSSLAGQSARPWKSTLIH